MRDLDVVFAALARSKFRSRFRLSRGELAYLSREGLAGIMQHAQRFVAERLGPSEPANDGRQTPMRGHPVFIAQHATGTCCRGCLEKWYGIRRGRPLSSEEQTHITRAIERWLVQHRPDADGEQMKLF